MSEQQTNKAESNPNLPQYMAEEIDRNPNGALAQAYKQSNGNLHDLLQIADRQGLIAQLPASMQGMVQEYQRDQQKARRDEEDFQRRMAAALAGSVFAMGEARNAEASQPQMERGYSGGYSGYSGQAVASMSYDNRLNFFEDAAKITYSDYSSMSNSEREQKIAQQRDVGIEMAKKADADLAKLDANAASDTSLGATPEERLKKWDELKKAANYELSGEEFEANVKLLSPQDAIKARELRKLYLDKNGGEHMVERMKEAQDELDLYKKTGDDEHLRKSFDIYVDGVDYGLQYSKKNILQNQKQMLNAREAGTAPGSHSCERIKDEDAELKKMEALAAEKKNLTGAALDAGAQAARADSLVVGSLIDKDAAKAEVKKGLADDGFGDEPVAKVATPAQPVAAARAPSINVGDPPKIGPNSSVLAQLGAPEEAAPADPAVQMQRKAPSAGMGASA